MFAGASQTLADESDALRRRCIWDGCGLKLARALVEATALEPWPKQALFGKRSDEIGHRQREITRIHTSRNVFYCKYLRRKPEAAAIELACDYDLPREPVCDCVKCEHPGAAFWRS